MPKKILVILGHPSLKSLNRAIADSYIEGAKKNFEVKKLYLVDLKFDPILHNVKNQKIEPDLVKAQELIRWADHFVFVYPIWWGGPPALLKGFIDRTLLSGFAYKYTKDGKLQKLLVGKTASMIMTTGGPRKMYSLFGRIMNFPMTRGVMRFTGITPKKQTFICGITKISEERAKEIFDNVRILGEKGI